MAKAYYNVDPNRQSIQLGMSSGIASEFKNKNQTARGGFNSGAAKGATLDKQKPTVTMADGLYSTTEVCATDVFATTSARGRGRGFCGGGDAAPREDAVLSQIVEEENRHKLLAPLPLDLLWQTIMRELDRIPHQIPKAGRIPCQNKGLARIFCLAFFADNNSIQLKVARNT